VVVSPAAEAFDFQVMRLPFGQQAVAIAASDFVFSHFS
jgi:hypothetical protein